MHRYIETSLGSMIDGCVSVPDPTRPCNLQNNIEWKILVSKIWPKNTQFVLHFTAIWYSDGSQNHTYQGIEMVEIPPPHPGVVAPL